MAEIIVCSGCQRRLQVPEQYIGQTVQCPDCGHMFVATATSVSAAPPSAAPPPSSAPASKPHYDDEVDERPSRRRYEDDFDDELDVRRGGRRPYHVPHRGGLIMALGLISLVGGLSFCVPFIIGPFAWVMGGMDLREMRAGRMDPDGESMTRTGWVCGIISSVILIVFVLLMALGFCAGLAGH